MNMIRHDHECVHMHRSVVFEEAMIEDQGTCIFGKDKVVLGAEADEVSGSRCFDVGEVSSVKTHFLE